MTIKFTPNWYHLLRNKVSKSYQLAHTNFSKCYPDTHPQVPSSSSTLHTLDLEDSPVKSVSEAPYRLRVTVTGGVAFGARLKGCASTSYGTIAGVLQLYGRYIDTTINFLRKLFCLPG